MPTIPKIRMMATSYRSTIAAFLFALSNALCLPTMADGSATLEFDLARIELDLNYFKFSVLLDSQGEPLRIVYQDANQYKNHAAFLATMEEFKGLTQSQIDDLTYKGLPKRRALLGVISIRNSDNGIWDNRFNITMSDVPTPDQFQKVRDLILNSAPPNFFPGGKLAAEILPHQESGAGNLIPELTKRGIPVASDGDKVRVPYTDSWNWGTIEWVGSEQELSEKIAQGKINRTTILVTNQNLREFPMVAGLISSVKLTPGSHAILLGQMHNVPVAYVKDAETLFKPLQGHKIFLDSQLPPSSSLGREMVHFDVDPSEEQLRVLKDLKVRPKLDVKLDPKETSIRSVVDLTMDSVPAYGGKASQMGLIATALPENSPKGAVAIPVSAYLRFIQEAKASTGQSLAAYIKTQLQQIPEGEETSASAQEILKGIRNEMKAATIPSALLSSLQAELEAFFPNESTRLRLRSSSNVEDSEDFNGAGLYRSTGIELKRGTPSILGDGLKKVWSSLYTTAGFAARRAFQVDESLAAMGVLVHPPFKQEVANGVASLYVENNEADTAQIVTYKGEENQVTHGTGSVLPEIANVSAYETFLDQPYHGYSKPRMVMPEGAYKMIRNFLSLLAQKYGKDKVHIEAEWKLMRESDNRLRIFVKQVRQIPASRQGVLKDGSRYYVIAPERIVLRPSSQDSENPFGPLMSPTDLKIQMNSFSERDWNAGRIQVRRIDFTIQGTRYSIPSPLVTITRSDKSSNPINFSISLPNNHLPTLNLQISLRKDPTLRSAHSLASSSFSFRLETAKDDFAFVHSLHPHAKLGINMDVVAPTSHLDDFHNPKIKGQETFTLSSTGTPAISVVCEEVKNRGEGESVQTKIGRATVYGVLSRPISVPATGIGYGSNHHQGMEGFAFDLFADRSLTPTERTMLESIAGRYLYFQSTGFNPTDRMVHFVRSNGTSATYGGWIREARQKRPAISAPMVIQTHASASNARSCEASFNSPKR